MFLEISESIKKKKKTRYPSANICGNIIHIMGIILVLNILHVIHCYLYSAQLSPIFSQQCTIFVISRFIFSMQSERPGISC